MIADACTCRFGINLGTKVGIITFVDSSNSEITVYEIFVQFYIDAVRMKHFFAGFIILQILESALGQVDICGSQCEITNAGDFNADCAAGKFRTFLNCLNRANCLNTSTSGLVGLASRLSTVYCTPSTCRISCSGMYQNHPLITVYITLSMFHIGYRIQQHSM